MFVKPSSNMIVVTDRDLTAGIVSTSAAGATGTMVSQGYLKVLIEALFEAARPVTIEQFAKLLSRTGFHEKPANAEKAARAVISATPGLTVSQAPVEIAPVRESAVTEGYIRFGRAQMWHPEGTSKQRKFGRYSVVLVQDTNSIRDRVKPDTLVSVAGIGRNGPDIGYAANGCSACAGCGVCGGCVICAEVNYFVAAAAAISSAAVTNLSAASYDPGRVREDFRMRDIAIRFKGEIEDLHKRTAPLAELAGRRPR